MFSHKFYVSGTARKLKLSLGFLQKLESKVSNVLFCVKMLYSKILVPHKYVVIGCHDVRMQKTFSIPPRKGVYIV